MCSDRRRLKRLMHTFPSTPCLDSDQFTRMLRDSSGVSVNDAGLDIGRLSLVPLHSRHDMADDQQRLTAELNQRRQQLIAEHDEAWAPIDLAMIVHCCVPRSTSASGLSILFLIPAVNYNCDVFVSFGLRSRVA